MNNKFKFEIPWKITVAIAIYLAIVAFAMYVIYHFVAKYW
jgi:hypothetical protein